MSDCLVRRTLDYDIDYDGTAQTIVEVLEDNKFFVACAPLSLEENEGHRSFGKICGPTLFRKVWCLLQGHLSAAVVYCEKDGNDLEGMREHRPERATDVFHARECIPTHYDVVLICNADFVEHKDLQRICEGRRWAMTCNDYVENVESLMTHSLGHATKSANKK